MLYPFRTLYSCLVFVTIPLLMVTPALADAPYAGAPSYPVSTVVKTGTAPVQRAPAATTNTVPYAMSGTTPVAASGATPYCPPCEYCGMYPPNKSGPRVASPQLQTTTPSGAYAPSYVPQKASAAQGHQPYQAYQPQAPYGAAPQSASQATPGTYAVGGYVSNLPMPPARPNPSIGEVWQRSGGARLQYDALRGPIQMYTNGMPVKDPANVHLPPLYPEPKPRARAQKNKTKPAVAQAPKGVSAQHVNERSAGNASHKPVAQPSTSVRPASNAHDAKKGEASPKVSTSSSLSAPSGGTGTAGAATKPDFSSTSVATQRAQPATQASLEAVSRPITESAAPTPAPIQSPYEGPAAAVGSAN